MGASRTLALMSLFVTPTRRALNVPPLRVRHRTVRMLRAEVVW